jgi:hypothetical protein
MTRFDDDDKTVYDTFPRQTGGTISSAGVLLDVAEVAYDQWIVLTVSEDGPQRFHTWRASVGGFALRLPRYLRDARGRDRRLRRSDCGADRAAAQPGELKACRRGPGGGNGVARPSSG